LAYRLTFKSSVTRDLRRLDKADADRVLTRLADELPHCAASCPELTGRFVGLRKYRVGEYRVIFAIHGETVLVTRIAHRRDAYRG
jgi:mRNA interferase RelE/StbE